MGIIDGEEMRLKCNRFGYKYTYIIGYGPVCPNPFTRKKIMKENPPTCSKCGSHDWSRRGFLDILFG